MILAKVLLLAHAVVAGVLTGALTHLALVVWHARRGRVNARLLRVYPPVALVAYGLAIGLGAALYPRYRVAVRAAWLEDHARWAAVLFDIKENLAVLIGPLVLAAWLSARRPRGLVLAAGAWGAAGGVWFNVLAGLLVTSVRAV